MTVRAGRIESAARVGQDDSVAAALDTVPGVDIRSQGIAGGQSDLSIRGSGFSAAGLTIGGLALNSPQTEHFNAELPLPASILTSPRVLTGIEQAAAVAGHLSGTVAYDLLPLERRSRLTLGVAERGGYWVDMLAQQPLPASVADGVVGVGGFGSLARAYGVDFSDNDVETMCAGGQVQWLGADSRFDLVVGRREKVFGARGYYGVTDAWPAEEKLDDTLLAASWQRGATDAHYLRATAIRRELDDDYALFWSLPGVYRNRHRTVMHSGLLDGRDALGGPFDLVWRVSFAEDKIRGAGLGNHSRKRGAVSLLPGVALGDWRVAAGARYDSFDDAPDAWLPQAAVMRRLGGGCHVRLSHVQTMRQPSYTELNYESPGSLGNAGLGNQTSTETELAVTGSVQDGPAWRVALFRRRTDRTVDWIRPTADAARWEATDIGTVDTTGVELALDRRFAGGSSLGVHYTWLEREHAARLYASRYALDYASHLLVLVGKVQIGSRVVCEATQGFRAQADNPLREQADEAYPAHVALHVKLPRTPSLQYTLRIANLWDDDFEPFPGQRTASPRRVTAGVTVTW